MADVTNITPPTHWINAIPEGCRVFPIRIRYNPDTGKNEKLPLVNSWPRDARVDWREFNWAGADGFGIVMGEREHGNIYALDIDDYKPGSEAWEWIRKWGLDRFETRIHTTVSGGQHWLWKLPDDVVLPSRSSIVPGLDSRGLGGWIAFGNGYSVSAENVPWGIPIDVIPELQKKSHRDDEMDDSEFTEAEWTDDLRTRVQHLIDNNPNFASALAMKEGDRSEALMAIAHQMTRSGFTSHEFSVVVMDVSQGAYDHVEEQKRPVRALKRAWRKAQGEWKALLELMPPPAETPAVISPIVETDAPEIIGNYKESGAIDPTFTTALSILIGNDDWKGVFRHDTFANADLVMRDYPMSGDSPGTIYPRPMRDSDYLNVRTWLQQTIAPRFGKQDVIDAIDAACMRQKFDSLMDYFDGLEWDGVPRIDGFLHTYFGVTDMPELYVRAVSRKWLIGAAKRALVPGCALDSALILEGRQGAGKSKGLAALVPYPDWFSDSLPDFHDKDAMSHLAGVWIVEMAELTTVWRSQLESMRSFLTRKSDKYRPSYGRKAVTQLRRTAFAGSTNRDDYAKDPEGERRFWIIEVGYIDIDAIARDRDQLWAEAKHFVDQGEEPYLSEIEARMAKEVQVGKIEEDPWYATLDMLTIGRDEITVREACELLQVDVPNSNSNQMRRIVTILKLLRFAKTQRRNPQHRGLIWKRG